MFSIQKFIDASLELTHLFCGVALGVGLRSGRGSAAASRSLREAAVAI
jgi:hypothetical protein